MSAVCLSSVDVVICVELAVDVDSVLRHETRLIATGLATMFVTSNTGVIATATRAKAMAAHVRTTDHRALHCSDTGSRVVGIARYVTTHTSHSPLTATLMGLLTSVCEGQQYDALATSVRSMAV